MAWWEAAFIVVVVGWIGFGFWLELSGCRCRMQPSPFGSHACCPKCGKCESPDGAARWYVAVEKAEATTK